MAPKMMKIRLSWLFATLLALGAGCAYDRPIKTAGESPRDRDSSSPSTVSRSPQTNGDESPGVLHIGPDRLVADSLWRDIEPEIKQQAKELTSSGYSTFLERRAAQLVTDNVAEVLLYQRAALRIPDSVKERVDSLIDADIRRIITTRHDGIERRYAKHLESRGETLEQVREKLRREYIITAYLEQEVKPKIALPTRDELWAAYKMLMETQDRPERRRMSLIDVRTSAQLPADVTSPTRDQFESARDAARAKAESALEEIRAGKDFAEVARRASDGLHAKDGGAWDWITRGSVRERFAPAADALYSLEEGAVSELIESSDGFMIVRCDEIDRAEVPDFQTVQPQLEDQYFRGMYNRHVIEMIAELREQARIEPQELERFHRAVVAAAPAHSSFDDSASH
jgi:parvulin-like peptidyl-prolyl isomerase